MASHHEVPLSLVDGDLETIIVGVDIGLTCTGTFAGLLTTASRAAQYDSKHVKRESCVHFPSSFACDITQLWICYSQLTKYLSIL